MQTGYVTKTVDIKIPSADLETADWKMIDISDKSIIESYGNNENGIAMFGFNSMYFWRELYKTSYRIIHGTVVARGVSDSGKGVIYFPRGMSENVKEIIDTLAEEYGGYKELPRLMPLPEETAELIKMHYGNAVCSEIEEKREYVYNRDDLAFLEGRKYHAKRNHIAKFDKNYNSDYTEITAENKGLLRAAAEYMYNLIEGSPADEYKAINEAIDNFEELNIRGCVISAEGKTVAYSIGSMINKDTADIHFEKADRSFEGSYAKVNKMFAERAFSDAVFLNREEDLGIEGLRKAKLSYNPCRLNKMYSIVF